MNPRDIKRMARVIRHSMTGEHYYDRKYKDLRVADLLLVLEDGNYHIAETVLEALATLDYYTILEACELEVEQSKSDYFTDELDAKWRALSEKIRRGKQDE